MFNILRKYVQLSRLVLNSLHRIYVHVRQCCTDPVFLLDNIYIYIYKYSRGIKYNYIF